MQDNLNGHLPQHESWKYILKVIEDETIFFKTKLAHILSNDFEKSYLHHLEIFQHRFLKMDEQVALLRHEVRELEEVLQKNNLAAIHPESIALLEKTMGAKIDGLRQSFDTVAADFRIYLRQPFS